MPAHSAAGTVSLQCLSSERPAQQQQQQLAAAALSSAAQSLQCWHLLSTSAAAASLAAGSTPAISTDQLTPYLQQLLVGAGECGASSGTSSSHAGAAVAAARLSWADAQLVFGCSLGNNHWHALKRMQQQEPLQAALLVLLIQVREGAIVCYTSNMLVSSCSTLGTCRLPCWCC
jgi:hypothetical protein